MTEFDTNVPLPTIRKKRKSVLEAMKPGESFEFPKKERPSWGQAAALAKRNGIGVYTIAAQDGDTCRIWRVS